jgi:pyruvate dehydrogenase E2 component (dihydrolipoamide acetyltransferase)
MADQASAADDVLGSQSSPTPPSAKGETRIEEPTRAERTIARRVAESRATVPDFELNAEVDMHEAAALWKTAQHELLTAVLTKACALALRDTPRANGAYRDGRFELYSRVNIGVGVPTGAAQTFPTVFDADSKSVAELYAEIGTSARRAREGELTPPELAGTTFTLFSVAGGGVAQVTPIITPPHAAAVGAGVVREAPVVRRGEIVAGRVMTVTLASDHRILYGAHAERFLSLIKELLEHPGSL